MDDDSTRKEKDGGAKEGKGPRKQAPRRRKRGYIQEDQ